MCTFLTPNACSSIREESTHTVADSSQQIHARGHVDCRDMVAITTGGLPASDVKTLKKDGWKVHSVKAVQNPNMRDDRKYPARFWAVYTKLNVFNLVQYSKGAQSVHSQVLPDTGWLGPQSLRWRNGRQHSISCSGHVSNATGQ